MRSRFGAKRSNYDDESFKIQSFRDTLKSWSQQGRNISRVKENSSIHQNRISEAPPRKFLPSRSRLSLEQINNDFSSLRFSPPEAKTMPIRGGHCRYSRSSRFPSNSSLLDETRMQIEIDELKRGDDIGSPFSLFQRLTNSKHSASDMYLLNKPITRCVYEDPFPEDIKSSASIADCVACHSCHRAVQTDHDSRVQADNHRAVQTNYERAVQTDYERAVQTDYERAVQTDTPESIMRQNSSRFFHINSSKQEEFESHVRHSYNHDVEINDSEDRIRHYSNQVMHKTPLKQEGSECRMRHPYNPDVQKNESEDTIRRKSSHDNYKSPLELDSISLLRSLIEDVIFGDKTAGSGEKVALSTCACKDEVNVRGKVVQCFTNNNPQKRECFISKATEEHDTKRSQKNPTYGQVTGIRSRCPRSSEKDDGDEHFPADGQFENSDDNQGKSCEQGVIDQLADYYLSKFRRNNEVVHLEDVKCPDLQSKLESDFEQHLLQTNKSPAAANYVKSQVNAEDSISRKDNNEHGSFIQKIIIYEKIPTYGKKGISGDSEEKCNIKPKYQINKKEYSSNLGQNPELIRESNPFHKCNTLVQNEDDTCRFTSCKCEKPSSTQNEAQLKQSAYRQLFPNNQMTANDILDKSSDTQPNHNSYIPRLINSKLQGDREIQLQTQESEKLLYQSMSQSTKPTVYRNSGFGQNNKPSFDRNMIYTKDKGESEVGLLTQEGKERVYQRISKYTHPNIYRNNELGQNIQPASKTIYSQSKDDIDLQTNKEEKNLYHKMSNSSNQVQYKNVELSQNTQPSIERHVAYSKLRVDSDLDPQTIEDKQRLYRKMIMSNNGLQYVNDKHNQNMCGFKSQPIPLKIVTHSKVLMNEMETSYDSDEDIRQLGKTSEMCKISKTQNSQNSNIVSSYLDATCIKSGENRRHCFGNPVVSCSNKSYPKPIISNRPNSCSQLDKIESDDDDPSTLYIELPGQAKYRRSEEKIESNNSDMSERETPKIPEGFLSDQSKFQLFTSLGYGGSLCKNTPQKVYSNDKRVSFNERQTEYPLVPEDDIYFKPINNEEIRVQHENCLHHQINGYESVLCKERKYLTIENPQGMNTSSPLRQQDTTAAPDVNHIHRAYNHDQFSYGTGRLKPVNNTQLSYDPGMINQACYAERCHTQYKCLSTTSPPRNSECGRMRKAKRSDSPQEKQQQCTYLPNNTPLIEPWRCNLTNPFDKQQQQLEQHQDPFDLHQQQQKLRIHIESKLWN